jgi:hypothetical protein
VSAKIIKFVARLVKPPCRRPAPPKRKAAPRLSPSIRALRDLTRETETFACSMLWIGRIAQRGIDPRALAALFDEFFDDYLDNMDITIEMLHEFSRAWRARMARGKKPRPVR